MSVAKTDSRRAGKAWNLLRNAVLLLLPFLLCSCIPPNMENPAANIVRDESQPAEESLDSEIQDVARPTYRDFADRLLSELGIDPAESLPQKIVVSSDFVLDIIPIQDALGDFTPVDMGDSTPEVLSEPRSLDVQDYVLRDLESLLIADRITYMIATEFGSDSAREEFRELVQRVGGEVFGDGFVAVLYSKGTDCLSCSLLVQDIDTDTGDSLAHYLAPTIAASVAGESEVAGRWLRRWPCSAQCTGLSWIVRLGCEFGGPPGPPCEQVQKSFYESCMYFCRTGRLPPKPEEYL